MSQTYAPQDPDRGSSVLPTRQPLPLPIKILDCLLVGIAVRNIQLRFCKDPRYTICSQLL